MFRSFSKKKKHFTYETVCLKLFLLPVKFFQHNLPFRFAETSEYFKTFRPFRQLMYDGFSVLQITYENYCYKQLWKRFELLYSTRPMHFMDSFSRDTLCRCVSRSVNSHNIMVIPSMFCFLGFVTASYHFPWCFCMFPPVFLQFP